MGRNTRPKKGTGFSLTHFLCLPLVNQASRPQLEFELQNFRNAITSNELDSNISGEGQPGESESVELPRLHPKAIRPAGAIHFTLGVMSLTDEAKLQQAIELLKSLDLPSLLEGSLPDKTPDKSALYSNVPISIDLRGLLAMHSPHKTSVLYAAPQDATGRLHPFCQSVQKAFKDSELLVPDDRPLKLHATIVNTIYAKRGRPKSNLKMKPEEKVVTPTYNEAGSREVLDEVDKQTTDQSRGKPIPSQPLRFDARTMIEQYKDTVWAEGVTLDRLAICKMGARKIMDSSGEVVDEVYTEVASVPLSFL